MKTPKEIWDRLKELEDIFDEYLDPFGEAIKKVDEHIIDHWCDRFRRLRDNIFISWGKELCEEQKELCHSYILVAQQEDIDSDWDEIERYIMMADLPDILKQ